MREGVPSQSQSSFSVVTVVRIQRWISHMNRCVPGDRLLTVNMPPTGTPVVAKELAHLAGVGGVTLNPS
jgi:hypothetical protein